MVSLFLNESLITYFEILAYGIQAAGAAHLLFVVAENQRDANRYARASKAQI